MAGVAVASSVFTLCSQRLLFAGQPVLFKTNDSRIARHASEFFPEGGEVENDSSEHCATVTVHVRESDEPCESAPRFRARGHFAFARFTRADAFWFNLRTREVYGVCNPELAADEWRWRTHIFPALLGILSPVIGVVPVHAACIVRGAGVLLVGHSGAGKSTLTVSMAKRGYALLSDDWTYLSPAGPGITSWSVPVPVKLLPDASRFFPELTAYRPGLSLNGEIAYEVSPEECFGVSRQMRCSVETIVLLERSANPRCDIVPVAAEEAIGCLIDEIEPLDGLLTSSYQRQLDLIRRLGDARCLRFSFSSSPDRVAAALDRILSEMR